MNDKKDLLINMMRNQLVINETMTKEIEDLYFEIYPSVKKYIDSLEDGSYIKEIEDFYNNNFNEFDKYL